MRSILVTTAVIVATLPAASAFDMPETKVTMEQCLKAALAMRSGEVRKLELEVEDGKPLYEFAIRTKPGETWELECDAATGEIIEIERNSSPNDPAWEKEAKLLSKQASDIAVKAHPGKVKGTEREIRGDGRPMWEVEIIDASGKEIEVHVDAQTGEILSVEHEADETTIYTIGAK
jgi:uncharacterized membrane protein YkoI